MQEFGHGFGAVDIRVRLPSKLGAFAQISISFRASQGPTPVAPAFCRGRASLAI